MQVTISKNRWGEVPLKQHVPEVVLYELRKVPLHFSNSTELRHKFGKKVYQILDWERANRVEFGLVLMVVSEVYGLVTVEDGLRLLHCSESDIKDLCLSRAEFIKFLDNISLHYTQETHLRKLGAARNRVIQFITLGSFLSLIGVVIYYIESSNPSLLLSYVIYVISGVCSIGLIHLLIVPIIIRTIRACQENRRLDRAIQSITVPSQDSRDNPV